MPRVMRDALNRRLRHAAPQPTDDKIVLTPRDLALFDAIRRHGPLPSHYLYEFDGSVGRTYHQHRLTRLYNGDSDGISYMRRPPQQFASYAARYQPLIYDLTADGYRALGKPPIPRNDPFLHRLMGACVAASLEISLHGGTAYISRDQIFAHPACPTSTRNAANPLALPIGNATLIPDDLFGIRYSDDTFRFFAVEVDRNTEAIERKTLGQTAYGRKLELYLRALREKSYRSFWGIPTLMVLTVTTNTTHAANMMDHLHMLDPSKLSQRFLFKARPEFSANWRVPGVMLDLFGEPWSRSGDDALSLS